MIKNIKAGSPYINVNSFIPHLTAYNTSSGACNQVKYDFGLQALQVYDGFEWQTLSQEATISLDPTLLRVVGWAQVKMHEEQQLAEKMKKFPALAKAHENYEIIKALVDNYKDDTNGT